MKISDEQYFEELFLNYKSQYPKGADNLTQIGYEVEEGRYVFLLVISFPSKKIEEQK